jgi:D-glycero-D-manno-heptose 1,7-bisphosphate phosphatase
LRKPNPGMALLAQKDFPKIVFPKSIMVGNKISDMEFGRNAGMHTVFVKTTHPEIGPPHPAIDLCFTNLAAFAKALQLK